MQPTNAAVLQGALKKSFIAKHLEVTLIYIRYLYTYIYYAEAVKTRTYKISRSR